MDIKDIKSSLSDESEINYDCFEYDDEPFYDKMTVDEWIRDRDMGIYCNDDGYGFYGTDTEISNIEVFSQLTPPQGMNYVYWYEK